MRTYCVPKTEHLQLTGLLHDEQRAMAPIANNDKNKRLIMFLFQRAKIHFFSDTTKYFYRFHQRIAHRAHTKNTSGHGCGLTYRSNGFYKSAVDSNQSTKPGFIDCKDVCSMNSAFKQRAWYCERFANSEHRTHPNSINVQ